MEVPSSTSDSAALGLAHLLQAVAAVPELVSMMRSQEELIRALRQEIKALSAKQQRIDPGGFLDAEGARLYLGGMAKTTFDRYRYSRENPIPGYKLDGKVYYRPSELDRWLMLYNVG